MKQAVLAMGSNLNDREDNIKRALYLLSTNHKIKIDKVSSIYETIPHEVPNKQQNYFNCCLVVKTELSPQTLLITCLEIEKILKRKRPYKNAARTIDIDILLYENERINSESLVIPHPRMRERAFVILPLKEIYPQGLPAMFNFTLDGIKVDNTQILRIVRNSVQFADTNK